MVTKSRMVTKMTKREFAYIEKTDAGRWIIKHRESDAVVDTFDDEQIAIAALDRMHEQFRGFTKTVDEIMFARARGKELPTEDIPNVKIFAVGRWRDSQGRPFNATKKILENIVESWKAFGRERIRPALKFLHIGNPMVHARLTGLVRLGSIDNLRIEGKFLMADFKRVPRLIAQLIKAGTLGRPSAEIAERFTDRNTGKTFSHVLTAAVTVGSAMPAVNTLPDIVKLFGHNPDDLQEFTAVDDAPFTSFTDPSVGDVVVMSFVNATLTDESMEPDQSKGGENMPESNTNDDRVKVLETTVTDNTRTFAAINAALGINANGDPLSAIKSLNERVETLETSIKSTAKAEFDNRVDGIIAKFTRFTDGDGRSVGKCTPADIPSITAMVAGFAATADDKGVVKFSDGKADKTGTVFEALIAHFERAPVVVEYDEHGKVKEPDTDGGKDDKAPKFIDDDIARFAEQLADETESPVVVTEFDERKVRKYMTDNKVDYVTAFAAVVDGAAMVKPPDGYPVGAVGNG